MPSRSPMRVTGTHLLETNYCFPASLLAGSQSRDLEILMKLRYFDVVCSHFNHQAKSLPHLYFKNIQSKLLPLHRYPISECWSHSWLHPIHLPSNMSEKTSQTGQGTWTCATHAVTGMEFLVLSFNWPSLAGVAIQSVNQQMEVSFSVPLSPTLFFSVTLPFK